MERIRLAGLLKWERPEGDVLLCDGGTVPWGSETYRSSDPLVGTITGQFALVEGVGDQAPAGRFTFTPPGDVDPADLSYGTLQGTRIQTWTAEIDDDTGTIIGTPKLDHNGICDVTWMRIGKSTRFLEVDFSAGGERLMVTNIGNALSGESHRRIWPGELGMNNALGVPTVVNWGVVGAPRGTSGGGGGGPGGEQTQQF